MGPWDRSTFDSKRSIGAEFNRGWWMLFQYYLSLPRYFWQNDSHHYPFPGLKDKEEKKVHSKVAQKDFRKSTDSIGGHSRNHSDGSSNSGFPPSGTRVVLGRETTPTPQSQYADLHSKLPREVTVKFDGTSRDVSGDIDHIFIHWKTLCTHLGSLFGFRV